MEGEDGSQLNLAPIFLATLRQLSKKSKPRVILASLVLYICFLSLSSMQLVQSMQRGKGLGRNKGRIKAKSTNDSVLLAEFGQRRKRVKDTCEKYGAYTTREKVLAKLKLTSQTEFDPGVETDEQLWSLIKKTSHHQFFVQREHGLMWCKVPKAASTSWLHAFLKLANVPDHLIPEDNGMGLHAFLRDKYPLLSKNLNKQFMTKSVKFVVVRHPFERIISAYLDKLHSYARDLKYRGGYYYAMYGADIVKTYRAKYQERFPKNPLFMRKEPSFVEFIEYLVGTPVSRYDEHWKPMFLLCPPCHFKFDVIVKMETFDRDTQFILSQRSLEDEVSLRKKHSSSSSTKSQDKKDDARTLFSQLSKHMVRALYDKYRLDFQMFDYDIKDFIKYASESEGFLPDVIELPAEKEETGETGEEEVTDDELSTRDVRENGETENMQA